MLLVSTPYIVAQLAVYRYSKRRPGVEGGRVEGAFLRGLSWKARGCGESVASERSKRARREGVEKAPRRSREPRGVKACGDGCGKERRCVAIGIGAAPGDADRGYTDPR